MAIRKRIYRRKRRNTRFMRRKTYRKRTSRSPILNVKRTYYTGTWGFGTASTNDFWRYETFTAGSINNFNEFVNVFDEYKINAIKVTYRPAYDMVTNMTGAASTIAQPEAYLHYIVDPGSTTVPSGTYVAATLNSFLEQPNVRTKTLNKPVSIYFKPKVVGSLYNTGTSATVERPKWVRTSEPLVQFRGYHAFIQQNAFSTGNINIKLDTYVTIYAQFRNLK